jgi:lysophospholipase L1-like esterase
MGRSIRRAGTLAIALALVIGATACKPEVTKEILFVNDSVTHQSILSIVGEMNSVPAGDAAGRFAPNFGSSVPGIGLSQVPGVSTQAGFDAYWDAHLSSLLGHVAPEVIVVELGYNDCNPGLAAYGAHIDNFMGNIPPETPVHWLTLHDATGENLCNRATINAALNAATGRWSNLSLLDFAAHMQGHPEWSPDGTHLNLDGQKAYANWLHDQLDSMYPDEA